MRAGKPYAMRVSVANPVGENRCVAVESAAQVKTAPEPPVVPLRQQREAVEGLARRYEGAPN